MLAVTIPDVKSLMNKLLKEDVFDNFEARTVQVVSFSKFDIQGEAPWSKLRPFVLSIIKSGERPKSFKLVLALDKESTKELHANAAVAFLNIQLEGEEIICTTGTSQTNFALDKSLDHVWEDYINNFFLQHNIITKREEEE